VVREGRSLERDPSMNIKTPPGNTGKKERLGVVIPEKRKTAILKKWGKNETEENPLFGGPLAEAFPKKTRNLGGRAPLRRGVLRKQTLQPKEGNLGFRLGGLGAC